MKTAAVCSFVFRLAWPALVLSACSDSKMADQPMTHADSAVKIAKQSDLDAISDKCGLARAVLQLHSGGEIQFQPPADANFEVVNCAFTELKRADFPGMKLGFVGHEQYASEPANTQGASK